jgi:DNA-binding transcriptional ArsR family regulator
MTLMTTNTTTRYYVHSWGGLITAIIAGGAATSIIVQDAFPNGIADWSHAKLEHALAPVIVGITAFLWLHAAREAREGRLAALALAAVAAFCSCLIVFESMGRGAEALDTKVKASEKTVSEYAALLTNLDRANKLSAEAESWVAHECKTGLGPKCRGVTYTYEQRKAHADKLKKEAETHDAPPPVDARGERVAFIAGLLGYDGEIAKKAAQSLYPLARPLAFEFVMILLLHASVRTREIRVIEAVPALTVEAAPVEAPKALSFESENGDRPAEEIEELKKLYGRVVELLAKAEEMNNQELAHAVGVSPGHMSRERQKLEAAGFVTSAKVGKEMRIRLAASNGKLAA